MGYKELPNQSKSLHMASVNTFYTSSEEVFNQTVSEVTTKTSEEDLDQVYEITKSIEWINQSEYKRVALQFPDELMPDAVPITNCLQKAVGPNTTVFILGDTSYGSCCVDEVAAQHYNADAIIHYGRSCLSQPGKMPTLFVFSQQAIDVKHFTDQMKILIPDTSTDLLLLYDTVYSYACGEVEVILSKTYTNISVSKLSLHLDQDSLTTPENQKVMHKCGRTIMIPNNKDIREYSVIFIGKESLTLTNVFYNFQPKELFSYNPLTRVGRKESVNMNKLLMKRYFLIEKAKDASIVGILVGTLGVANYVDILNRLKHMIKKAGKKSYVFIVGKINVAKLANFMEIDIFVLIACSENTLLDSSEFYKPVITPYEMEIACNLREWTGDYPTEFNSLLSGGSNYVEIPDQIDKEETDISLVTGKLRHLGQKNDLETGTAVISRSEALQIATQPETAGQFLELRSWKGLEQNLGETPVTKAVEGQKGIAMGYTSEPNNK